MCAIGNPVEPLQFVKGRNALKSFVSGVKYTIVFDILWKVKLGTLNSRECVFDDAPKGIPGGLGALLSDISVSRREA